MPPGRCSSVVTRGAGPRARPSVECGGGAVTNERIPPESPRPPSRAVEWLGRSIGSVAVPVAVASHSVGISVGASPRGWGAYWERARWRGTVA
jgi:hypothetical protein